MIAAKFISIASVIVFSKIETLLLEKNLYPFN